MASTRAIPNHADLKPYSFAVAGHEGTLCDPDGELFIKPCTQQEIEFYETAIRDHKAFASLMPVYIGTLALNDATDVKSLDEQLPAVAEYISPEMKEEALRLAREAAAESAAAEPEKPKDNITWKPNNTRKIATNTSVVLENAAYGYTRPNILDAKLGSRLWADDAPLEKRQRFDKITKSTTNGSHGFRIAGMRVYKGSENAEDLDEEGYRVYGKDYGRFDVTPHNVVSEMKRFIFNPQAGVDDDLGKIIAGAFVEDLKRVEEVLANEESRMFSASLLFTFEGDGSSLREAIENLRAQDTSSPQLDKELIKSLPALSASRVDSGIVMDDDGELITGADEKLAAFANGQAILGHGEFVLPSPIAEHVKVLELGNDDTFGTPAEMMSEFDEGFEDEEELSSAPQIYSLKLIDFAHAEWVPGQGPDENVLFGVRSLIKIFQELSE